jgi:hypothetical protein
MSGIRRLSLVAIAAASSLMPVNAGQLRVRSMDWDPSISITSRLRDDDEMVVVGVTGDTVHVSGKAKDVALWGASSSDMVVVMTLESIHPLLVRNGTWIFTSLQGVVQQVLKSHGKVPVSPGTAIELQIKQGEMEIGKVLVQVGSRLPFTAGREYLFFLHSDAEVGALVPTLAPLLVDGDTLETLGGGTLQADGTLAGLTLRDVASIVKKGR